ncbi:alpha/beta hydrolase [Nocardia bovistercoris]|uniref:Alpha/beta fold hydrolase n=1 Tax=Nocardia bovistercoris TaxID=2785916 RepID=A0A931N3Q6_9NOCA|nr:alpha/beta fold hydrolase [Nocardia bovistercoris]MBH0777982.1 alpha/beta fold hydrolase [Nocardia bovistercoris]
MSAPDTDLLAADTVVARTVEVDGVTMSALCAEVPDPRAVLVAVHGGATSARYFDLPGRPSLSLLRTGARLGFSVYALDRPGYGESAPWEARFESPAQRVDITYRAIDALLASDARGAGVFLAAHSAGCDLAAYMAADDRGAELIGLELAGTGVHKHPEAARIIEEMRYTRRTGGIKDLLWYPEYAYPPEVYGGRGLTGGSPGYESAVVRDWPTDFPTLAARVRIPTRFSYAEFERVWRCDAESLAEIQGFFTAAPRFVLHQQAGSGHNVSVGFGAAAYHLGLLSFVEECVLHRSRRSVP